MKWGALGLAVGLTLLGAGVAGADQLRGAVGPVTEHRHRVTLTLHRGYAVWEAERELSSQGAGQAILSVDLPAVGRDSNQVRAVPVGLRLRQGSAWRDGVLQDVEAADDQYFLGGGEDEAAALLTVGLGLGDASLRVSGMHPGARREVGYRLVVPTRYEGGHYRLSLPASAGDGEEVDESLHTHLGLPPTIVPRAVGGALVVAGQPWPDGEPVRFDARRGLELGLRPPAGGWTIDGALAVIPFGRRFLTHAHVEIVPELSVRPRGARVVLVLDRSRSMTEDAFDGARAAAAAYLAHLPDAGVEIVTFDRTAERRYGRFVDAATARRDLARWRPARGNGSELGVALALATQLLADAPEERPRRIVVLTDGSMRHDMRVAALTDDLGGAEGPLTQIVRLHPPRRSVSAGIARDDESEWVAVASSTGGLAWTATFPGAVEAPPDLAPLVERLVRPTMLTSFAVESAPFLDTGELFVPTLIREGEGADVSAMLDAPLPWLTVKGKRWHEDVSVTLPVHDAEIPIWAALAFGDDMLPLDDDAVARRKLADRGGAVTELTSYAVGRTVEPPVPETFGVGRLGHGQGFSTRCGMGHGRAVTFEGREWLETQLRQALYACGAEEHRATVHLETIDREVAQVDGVRIDTSGAPGGLAACLDRATWALDLPAEDFADRPSRRWAIEVKAILP